MHMDDITGSLEPGKRADLILVDNRQIHNAPFFRRDPNAAYAQIVYASKATDVSDVMINGQWVMRGRELLTLNEAEILAGSMEYARQIDAFLTAREQSVLAKLIAIGGATEEESFEVQAKVPISNEQPILQALLHSPKIEILRKRHYREYDTYFLFNDAEQGRLRIREDHFVDDQGKIDHVRSRLTHVGVSSEYNFPSGVLLSRSRFLAPATQSTRFYREYFRPDEVMEIEKDRLRYLVRFEDTEFFINIDTLIQPSTGKFLEGKSRTWSRKDAEQKSTLAAELIALLGASPNNTISRDYVELLKP